MAKTKKLGIIKEDLKGLYLDKRKTTREIANLYSCSNHTISYWLRKKIFKKYGWEIIFLSETEVNEEDVGRRLTFQ